LNEDRPIVSVAKMQLELHSLAQAILIMQRALFLWQHGFLVFSWVVYVINVAKMLRVVANNSKCEIFQQL